MTETQKLTKEIIVPKDKAEFYRTFEGLTGEQSAELGEHYDNMYCEEVTFDNGYKVIIEFIIADYDNPNWVEGILFNPDGEEVDSFSADNGTVFAEWFFQTEEPDVEYTVIVKEGI